MTGPKTARLSVELIACHSGDVLIRDEQKHAEDQHKADHLNDALGVGRKRFALDFFEDQKGEQPAVDDRDGRKFTTARLALIRERNQSSQLIPRLATWAPSWAIPTGPITLDSATSPVTMRWRVT